MTLLGGVMVAIVLPGRVKATFSQSTSEQCDADLIRG
jgi:hypothetical protein